MGSEARSVMTGDGGGGANTGAAAGGCPTGAVSSCTRCNSSWESNGFFKKESAPAARASFSSKGSKVPTSSSTGTLDRSCLDLRHTS